MANGPKRALNRQRACGAHLIQWNQPGKVKVNKKKKKKTKHAVLCHSSFVTLSVLGEIDRNRAVRDEKAELQCHIPVLIITPLSLRD